MRAPNGIRGGNDEAASRGRRIPLRGKAFAGALTALVGILLGLQIYNPSKRFIEAIVGLLVIGVVWNYSPLQAVWLIIITYPFPFAFSLGNSTVAFTLVVFVIYMVRVSTGVYRLRGNRLLNIPVLLMVFAYIVSFYNQSNEPGLMRFALIHTSSFFTILIFSYMLVNLIDTEEKLRKTVKVFLVSTALVALFSFIELLFPGRVILPNLVYSVHKISLVMKDIRVAGPFRDYELLAEFFAMNVPILVLMIARSGRLLTRSIYGFLLIWILFMQFSTITRGAFVSLLIGVAYMAWICRKDLNIVRFVGLVGASIGALIIIDLVMSRYTVSGSLFARLLGTTIERGFIPDTRVNSWTGAVERWLRHPFLGNGPGWDFSYNIERRLWPHNSYLYYLNVFGVFGTAAFMFLLYRLVRTSLKETGHSLVRAPFPQALMKVLHVSLIIFIIDMTKTDFQRNDIYSYFVWIFFALICASREIIDKSEAAARGGSA